MGQAASSERLSSGHGGSGGAGISSFHGGSGQVKRRIELLEELCTAREPARRVQVLQQLSAGQKASSQPDANNRILPSAPPEFRPGRLIAAGCAGRVYAGTYCDQPAALKVLILDEDTAHEILNEVRLCLKLQHRNLVQLLDCAVVATSRHDAASQMPGSPAAAISQHSFMPLFGGGSGGDSSGTAQGSAQWPYSYLPVVPGGQLLHSSCASPGPAAPAAGASSSSTSGAWPSPSAALHAAALQHEPGSARVPSSFSQACFEVWIAMELCDAGTLSEQLQQGFHCHPGSESVNMEHLLPIALDVARALAYMHRENVCHGDLTADNVLLKTVSGGSGVDTACSSYSQDDCSWLGMLCSSSGSNTAATCSRSRRCSTESTCWSCVTKGFDSSSYSDTESSNSSNASSMLAEREQRRHNSSRPGGGGSFKDHLLSGLSCISPASSCNVNDDDEVSPRSSFPRAPPGGFFSCGGCGVMTLEPSARATSGRLGSGAGQQQQGQQREEVQSMAAAGAVDAVHQEELPLSPFTLVPYTSCAAAAAASVRNPQLFQALLARAPRANDEGAEQLGACSSSTAAPQPHSLVAEEGTAEIEAVAPLSLYTQARQRRRSRCLPHSVLLPAALAAAAAAAAAAVATSSGAEHACNTSASASPVSSDDDECFSGQRSAAQRSQGLARGSPSGAATTPAAAPAGASVPVPAGGAAPPVGDEEGEAQHGDSVASHEVYAMSAAMLPTARSRVRRHSYCYGSSSSYASLLAAAQPGGGAGSAGSSRLQQEGSGISAAEAATAIAAAAEAVRADSLRAAAAAAAAVGEQGSRARRSRRMSWDDGMLRQQLSASGALGSLLSAALPGLARTNSEAVAPADERRRRTSWAGYLQPGAASTAAMAGPITTSSSSQMWQQQLLQQPPSQHLATGSSHSSDTAAPPCGPRAAQGGRRRARRHSWACTEAASPTGPGQALSKLVSLRALTSCFAAGTDGLPQHLPLGSLAACIDDPTDGAQEKHSMRESLLGGGRPGSTSLQRTMSERLTLPDDSDAGSAVGCFGRWCGSNAASSTANSSSFSGVSSGGGNARRPPRGRGRRYSWCCGAGDDAQLWADLEADGGGSSMHLALLSAGSPLSVPLPLDTLQGTSQRPRRDRRCSWDEAGLSCQRSIVIGRTASSLDVRVNTPDSWRSSAAGSSNAPAALLRAGSNGEAAEAAAAVAAARSSAFGEVQQIHASQGEECDVCSSRRSSLDSTSISNAASDSSDDVCRELVSRTGAKLPDWTAAAPAAGARATDAALDELQGDQGINSQQAFAQPLPLLVPPPQHAPAVSAGPAAAVAAAAAAQPPPRPSLQAGPLLPSEPLEGSFSLQRTTSGSGRGRRWSTGVSAGHLLLREQSFLEASGKQPGGGAAAPGRGAAEGNVADGSKAPHAPPAAAGVAASTQAVDTAAGAAHHHDLQPAGSSSDDGAGLSVHRTCSVTREPPACSSPTAAVVNVLGMPRRPAADTAALTQRRMSYDTATGAYQLVSALDSVQLVQALGAPAAAVTQQLQQQLHGSPDTIAAAAEVQRLLQDCRLGPAAGPAEGSPASPRTQAAQQQHCEAQMQRLLDALARKGYAGLNSCSVTAASAAGSSGTDVTADIASSSRAGSARVAEATTPAARASLEQQQHRVQAKQQQQEQRGDNELLPAVTPRPHYCAKVCDFGYSKCLRAGQSHCSTASAGTLTHQAPEVLRHGHLSPAADVYAFGIILWELLMRERPFRGLLEGDLVVGVCDNGLRPLFPPGCPPSYVALAQQCWADDPSQRPTAVQLVRRLNELLYEERRARLKATAGSTDATSGGSGGGAAGAAAHDKQHCRPRRHSMPVQGGSWPRRRWRRFSLFQLPFSRQPAVPEDAPFEEHLGHWHHSGSTSGSHHVQQQQQQQHGSQEQPHCSSGAAAGAAGPHACRTCGGAIDAALCGGSTRSPASTSSSGHAVLHTSGPLAGHSSSSNAVVSAGGLLASGNAFPRRSASLSGSAAAPAGSSTGLAVAAAGTSGSSSGAADGSEWFQSFN